MVPKKRQYGSGCLLKRRKGWAIRWREVERAPDGTTVKVLRYELLGPVSKAEAGKQLAAKLAIAGTGQPVRSRVMFRTIVTQWEATVLPVAVWGWRLVSHRQLDTVELQHLAGCAIR